MTTVLEYQTNYRTPEWDPRTRRVITVDGEGDTIEGTGERNAPHAYTLLAAGDDRGFRACIQHDGTRNGRNYGLSTVDCLEFLLGLKQHDSDLLIGFAFTYDDTMILHDLSNVDRKHLVRNGWVRWRKYYIEFTPKQSLRVADIASEYVDERGRVKYRRSARVYDTFAFFQKSFVSVLEDAKKGVLDPARVAFIADMKAQRNNFAEVDDAVKLEYCYAECEYMSIVFRDLMIQLDRAGYAVNKWYGPGPVVMAFFAEIELRKYMPVVSAGAYDGGMPEIIPTRAYYGGRFEISRVGFCGDGWNHDINSAYPAAMVLLPCLAHGRWRRTREYVPGRWGFYKAGSNTSGQWAPFPFRVGSTSTRPAELHALSEGSIVYAHGGVRWVGHFEYEVAVKHFGESAIPIYDGWVWEPACNHRPMRAIADLYDKRLEAKAAGDGIEKAYKLIINSGYGKTAQGIGWVLGWTTDQLLNERDAYSAPKYQCYPWAAWITSMTRAMVTDIALSHPTEVISIATDGILSTKRLEELPISKRLGEWDEKEARDIWLGMPGIYTYSSPGTDGYKEDFKRRGFSAKHFPAEYLRESWKRGSWSVDNLPEEGYTPTDPTKTMRAFVAIRQAMKAKDPDAVYGRWVGTSKHFDFLPLKRIAIVEDVFSHDGTVIDTFPITLPDDAISKPYTPKQTWQDVMEAEPTDLDIYYLSDEELI